MGIAFEGAVAALKINGDDETRREAVAQFIIHLAQDESLDAATLRDRTVKALGGLTLKYN
jgi:hypothetical protein